MNRAPKPPRPTPRSPEALLESGRKHTELAYDVERGLARHHEWLERGAQLPDWSTAGPSSLGASSIASIVMKSIVAVVVVSAGVVTWYMQQPEPATRAARPPNASVAVAHAPEPAPVDNAITAPAAPSHTLPPSTLEEESGPHETTRRAIARSRRKPSAIEHEQAATDPMDHAASPPPRATAVTTASPESVPQSQAVQPPPRLDEPSSEEPRPPPKIEHPTAAAEMTELAAAEKLLSNAPARSLALVRKSDQRFPDGYFKQERAYVAIMALIGLGRIEDARAEAARFAERYPRMPYGARIERALESHSEKSSGSSRRPAASRPKE
jgi:hypothetical protein